MNWELQKQADSIKFDSVEKKHSYSVAKKTLDCIISYCDEDNTTFVSIDIISKRIMCGHGTVARHFEMLKNLGILEIKKVGRKTYKTVIFAPYVAPDVAPYVAPDVAPHIAPDVAPYPQGAKKREDKRREDKRGEMSEFDIKFDTFFDSLWDEYRATITKYRNAYGSRSKTKIKVKAHIKQLKKDAEWDSLEELFDWFLEFVNNKLATSQQFTKNLERWDYEEIMDGSQ